MGIATKNLQSEENIKRMAAAARPGVNVTGIKELTEGLCNVAYDISWEDGTSSILKIASSDRSHNTSNEVALMKAEVKAMKIVKENCSFPVAQVLYYDTSRRLCDGDYFFMEKLPGENLMYIHDSLPAVVQDRLHPHGISETPIAQKFLCYETILRSCIIAVRGKWCISEQNSVP